MMDLPILSLSDLPDDILASMQQDRKVHPELSAAIRSRTDAIIVLDDDPTGTQTVYGVPVLTDWKTDTIVNELERGTLLFFVLTNSRSLAEKEAKQLALEIGANVQAAQKLTQKRCMLISRSDSTLRGHYPLEVDALLEGLADTNKLQIFIPVFFEGGRYTIDDIHYVRDAERLTPAAQTSYGQDHYFGFQHSYLPAWVEEKTQGRISQDQVVSFSLQELTEASIESLIAKLDQCQRKQVVIVNAVCYQDLQTFALAMFRSKQEVICRTAASFVAAIFNQTPKALLGAEILSSQSKDRGSLVVVGSYVPKTTQQLMHLQQNVEAQFVELDIKELLSAEEREKSLKETSSQIDLKLQEGIDVVLYTSRDFIAKDEDYAGLDLGALISSFIIQIVGQIKQEPRYLITKGGITSSDVATQSLRIQTASVMGQILPGVPVWRAGPESRFPGLAVIIFPGNVGQEDSLSLVLQKLQTPNDY